MQKKKLHTIVNILTGCGILLLGVLFAGSAGAQTPEINGLQLAQTISSDSSATELMWQNLLSGVSELLNILLIILAVFLVATVYNLVQCLQQKQPKVGKTIKIIPPLVAKSASRSFIEYSYKDDSGTYVCSFDQHKRLHSLTRKVLGGASFVVIAKLVLIFALSSFFGAQVSYEGIAQSSQFAKDGVPVQLGDVLTYALEFSNTGTAPATDIVISNPIDVTKVDFIPASGGITINGNPVLNGVDFDAGIVTFQIDELEPGDTGIALFSVQVKDISTLVGETITNQATIAASNFAQISSNAVSNPIGAGPTVPLSEEVSYEGIFEPLCCVGGGTECDPRPNTPEDIHCETGEPLLGTRKHRFVIPLQNVFPGSGSAECTIVLPNGQTRVARSNYTVEDGGEQPTVSYIVTDGDQVPQQGALWEISSCSFTPDAGRRNPVPELDGTKIYVHGNTWTGVESADADAKRALDCYAGAEGVYFDNTENCDFGGDVAFAIAMSAGASVEGICSDSIDNDGNGIIDCSDSSCRGISYPSCTSVEAALIASGGAECAGNICSGSVIVGGKNVTYQYTQHAQPGGRFKVKFNNGSLTSASGGISNYISFIPEFDNYGSYAAPGSVTLPDESVFPNETNPETYQTQSDGLNGTVNQVMWVDFKDSVSTAVSDAFELLLTQNGGLQRVTNLRVYPDDAAPSNNDESESVPALGLTNTCADGVDNDLDFTVDCLDNQCDGEVGNAATGALCEFGAELTCDDGFDNDRDGVADCLDSDCNGRVGGTVGGTQVYCEFGTEQAADPGPNHCTDGFDNDADGALDCQDQSACWKQDARGCAATETSCSDGIDNDLDSDYSQSFDANPDTGVDCSDYDCAGDPACPASEYIDDPATCFDGIDNDLDTAIDCYDSDCAGVEFNGQACLAQEFTLGVANLCTDRLENDFDAPTAVLDCSDNQLNREGGVRATSISNLEATDCWARFNACAPCPSTELITYDSCADGLDNDYDNGAGGYAPGPSGYDCSDSDCNGAFGNYRGAQCGGEFCSDGFDNDADGLTDCRDPQCAGQTGPQGQICEPGTELTCNDGFDNDGGGNADCFDTDCAGVGDCSAAVWNTTSCTQVPHTTNWVNLVSGGTVQWRHTDTIYQNGTYSLSFRGQASSYDSLLITIGQGQFPFDVFACSLSGSSELVYSATESGVAKIQNSGSPIGSFTVNLSCPTNGVGAGFSGSYGMSIAADGAGGTEVGNSATDPQVTVYETVPPVVSKIEVEGEVSDTVSFPYGQSRKVRGIPSDASTGNSGICGCEITIDGDSVTSGNTCQTTLSGITSDGSVIISVAGIDGASNQGGASQRIITADVTPVELDYQKLSRAYYNSANASLDTGSVRFRTADNGSFGDCNATIYDSVGAAMGSQTINKTGTSDITCNGTLSVGSLTDGQYTLEVTATDEDGAKVTSKKIFFVCNDPNSPGCEYMDMDNDGFPENTSTDLYASIYGGSISCDMCPGAINTGVDSDGDGIDDACDEDAVVLCGNGVIDIGETCDDSNRLNGDGCSSTCQTETTPAGVCGNGITESGEQCDDGNTVDADGCSSACTLENPAACGNGVTDSGEQCDDGNTLSGDGCSQYCQIEAVCGNGELEAGEQCDDGNTQNGDGCDTTCQNEVPAVCGNSTLEVGEECDDGNTENGDGCSAQCISEVPRACGNGILEIGETCDDGNTINGDGCSASCFTEQVNITSIQPPTITDIQVLRVRPLGGSNDDGGERHEDDTQNSISTDSEDFANQNRVEARLRVRGTGSEAFEQIRLTINSETKIYEFAYSYPGIWSYTLEDVFTVGQHSATAQGIDAGANATPKGPARTFTIGLPEEEPLEELNQLLEQNVLESALPAGVTQQISNIKNQVPGLKRVVDDPEVENAFQRFIAPGITTVALINTIPAVSVGLINILPYLHLMFLEPLRALFRKKRKKWGVVYNSLTKVPVDLAVVRLYNKETRQLVQTKVTDAEGRYIMLVKEPGTYYLQVQKPNFIFPTDYLKEDRTDTEYVDLYHGEEIQVSEKGTVVTANIPLDPLEQPAIAETQAVKNFVKEKAQVTLSWAGIALSVVSFVIYPTVLITGFLLAHIAMYFLFRRLAVPKQPKSWGIVYDSETREPIKHAVIRIFDKKFNRLLETQVTDAQGRYSFLVGKNVYQVVAEKAGYSEAVVDELDLTKKEDIVNLDLSLSHKNG